MNWDEAVEAHVKWKIRLQAYINGGGEKLDAVTIGKDNVCPLGKWIYEQEPTLKANKAFQVLKTDHASFHKSASEIVVKVDSGDKAGAMTLMGSGRPFMSCSMKVVGAISAIRNTVK
jgi:methyl-accepting chemotaxis protein